MDGCSTRFHVITQRKWDVKLRATSRCPTEFLWIPSPHLSLLSLLKEMKCMYLGSVHLLGSYFLQQNQRSHTVFSHPSSSPDICFCVKKHWSILLQSEDAVQPYRRPSFEYQVKKSLSSQESCGSEKVTINEMWSSKHSFLWTVLLSEQKCILPVTFNQNVSVIYSMAVFQQSFMLSWLSSLHLSKPAMVMKSNIWVPFVCKYFKDTNKFHCLFMKHFRAVAMDRY